MRISFASAIWLGLGLVIAGCGGGSGGSGAGPTNSAPTGPSQTATVGNASITYQGNLRATVTATSSSVTSLGVSGASISSLAYYPTNNIADTNIVYEDEFDLYSYSERTNMSTDITHNALYNQYPSVSNNGFVAFVRRNSTTDLDDIWVMRADGTGQVRVTNGAEYYSVSIAPNGSSFAAIDESSNLVRVSSSGVATTLFTHGTIYPQPYYGTSWSPDSSRIVFYGSNNNLYTIPSSGGTPTLIYSGLALQFPTWSADSSQIVASANGGIYIISSAGPSTQSARMIVGSSTLEAGAACFSPDGKKIAYLQVGSGYQGVYTCDPNGNNIAYIAPISSSFAEPIFWSGYLTQENMIGSGGVLTSVASSGFVVTNGLKGFGSALSFVATIPSTAIVSATSSDSGPLGFTVSASYLSSVSWINSYYGPSTTKALTNTQQLLFGIDGSSGQVSFVAPALSARSSAVAKVTKGASTTYSGKFTSVFDGQGNNLAPGGATSITVDAKTSRVLSTK